MKDAFLVEWASTAADGSSGTPYHIGYMRRAVVDELAAIPRETLEQMGLDPAVDVQAAVAAAGTVPLHRLLRRQATEAARTQALTALAQYWRARGTFKVLRGWRDEPWPVYGREGGVGGAGALELLFSVERAAAGLLGVVRYGVHLTAYVGDGADDIRIWVPRRAADKSTYPGMLDNSVAGGLMTGEDPFDCVVREADEEASLPEAVVRGRARFVGLVTYVYVTDERAGGAPGDIYPECEWTYDLRLPDDGSVVPQPKDGEVESFMLCSVAEVRAQLARGEYKPNCAVVLLDFFVRHGLLTPASEPAYDAIVRRLHRVLPFPGPQEAGK